ncbi:hypothetical protein HanOQP8_Chr06g0229391 [Helianthus annuus]|nr:hypothetical protein HanHA89_Chr06g0236971 [Helianthus annuus]KAJ0738672.1 hypothetical protein HanLR1_Chr06g0220911 [Helianthus annuus]KAJ0741558.1 hypothetical protein HanOQP8_Chr06g0229391 [Helianthus annuus]
MMMVRSKVADGGARLPELMATATARAVTAPFQIGSSFISSIRFTVVRVSGLGFKRLWHGSTGSSLCSVSGHISVLVRGSFRDTVNWSTVRSKMVRTSQRESKTRSNPSQLGSAAVNTAKTGQPGSHFRFGVRIHCGKQKSTVKLGQRQSKQSTQRPGML